MKKIISIRPFLYSKISRSILHTRDDIKWAPIEGPAGEILDDLEYRSSGLPVALYNGEHVLFWRNDFVEFTDLMHGVYKAAFDFHGMVTFPLTAIIVLLRVILVPFEHIDAFIGAKVRNYRNSVILKLAKEERKKNNA